jgi:hypothetical protein
VLTTTSENEIPDRWDQSGVRDRQHNAPEDRRVQTVKPVQRVWREEPAQKQRIHRTGPPIHGFACYAETLHTFFDLELSARFGGGIAFSGGNAPRALAYDISAKWDRVITDSFFQARLPGSRERKEPRDAAQLAQGFAEPKGGNIG